MRSVSRFQMNNMSRKRFIKPNRIAALSAACCFLILVAGALLVMQIRSYKACQRAIIESKSHGVIGILWSRGEVVISYRASGFTWNLDPPDPTPIQFDHQHLVDALQIPWVYREVAPPQDRWRIVASHNPTARQPGRRTQWMFLGFVYELGLIGFSDGQAIIDTRKLLIPRAAVNLVASIIILLSTIVLVRIERRQYRLRQKLCTRCGYDLRFATSYCPECGAAYNATSPQPVKGRP
jgi:hypothetical protein